MSKPVTLPAGWVLARLWLGLLAGCAQSAQAAPSEATVCVVPDAVPASAEGLISLQKLTPQCHKNAAYLYLLGRVLNQLGRYAEAIDPLEGALLYRPEHWASQLEYAIALEGAGDHSSALSLLQSLLRDPAVDRTAQLQIARLLQRQAPQQPTRSLVSYSLATGFDDNLLGSTHHTQLELTTPMGLLPVELGPDQAPHPGAFVRAEVRYEGLLPLGVSNSGARWRYSLDASYRASPGYSLANQSQLGALLERSNPDQLGLYLVLQRQTWQRASSTTLKQTQVSLGYDFGSGFAANCQQRLGLELLRLAYPTSPVLNGLYSGILGQVHCPGWGLQLQLRAGQDQPADDGRPGGVQQLVSLRASKLVQLDAAALALEWHVTHQLDQSGYSLLLDNNAPRHITRMAYRLEYRWKAANLRPFIGFEWLDQHANLALFETKNRVLTLGFRSNW